MTPGDTSYETLKNTSGGEANVRVMRECAQYRKEYWMVFGARRVHLRIWSLLFRLGHIRPRSHVSCGLW